jgi:glucose/arabinose dehydrogenase
MREWRMPRAVGSRASRAIRFRDVKQGPDGALYVLSDVRPSSPAGPDKIYRLVPKKR